MRLLSLKSRALASRMGRDNGWSAKMTGKLDRSGPRISSPQRFPDRVLVSFAVQTSAVTLHGPPEAGCNRRQPLLRFRDLVLRKRQPEEIPKPPRVREINSLDKSRLGNSTVPNRSTAPSARAPSVVDSKFLSM